MPALTKYDPDRMRGLKKDFEGILNRLTEQLDELNHHTNSYKNSINDRTSDIAIKIVNEYRVIIKNIQESFTEYMNSVQRATEQIAYIESELADNLK